MAGCDCPCGTVEWKNIVGNKTLQDGGYFGDLMSLGRLHIEESLGRGELTHAEAGQVYSTLVQNSIQQAINFELNDAKVEQEICFLNAQKDWQVEKTEIDRCLADSECALNAKKGELIDEQIQTEDLKNRPDGLLENEIIKMRADAEVAQQQVEIAKAQVALEEAKAIGTIRKEYGFAYSVDPVTGEITVGEDLGDGKIDSEIDDIVAAAALKVAQTEEIPKDSRRKDCKTQHECDYIVEQIEKIKTDIVNETDETASKISLNAAQENKLACDCCNASKLANADVLLKDAQECLYRRQTEGFNDHALQKLYEAQLQTWGMVFSDTDAEVVTPSLYNEQICATFAALKARYGVQGGGACEEREFL